MKSNKLFPIFVLLFLLIPTLSSPSSALKERSFTVSHKYGTVIEISLSLDSLLLDTNFIPMNTSVTLVEINPHASEISGIIVKVRFSKSPDTLSSVSHGTIDTIGSSSHTHRMIFFDKKWGSSRLEVYIKWNEHIWQIYSEWMKIFSVRPDNIFNRYNYVFLPVIALSSSVLAYFLFTRYLKKRNLTKLPPLCQECDFQPEPDSKFCPNCGKKYQYN